MGDLELASADMPFSNHIPKEFIKASMYLEIPSHETLKVLHLAGQEALGTHSDFSAEHVLLALLKEPGAQKIPFHAIQSVIRNIPALVSELESAIKTKTSCTLKRAQVLKWTLLEARNLGHLYLNPDHMLLGLLRECEEHFQNYLSTSQMEDIRTSVYRLHPRDTVKEKTYDLFKRFADHPGVLL